MGEFTTRFDAEIMRSKFAEIEAKRLEEEKAKAEVDKVGKALEEIGAILSRRASFLAERFKNATRQELEGEGFELRFAKSTELRDGLFALTARIKDSRLAIIVESRYEIPSLSRKQYDYINLPVSNPDVERARRFIESKLVEFAREYVAY